MPPRHPLPQEPQQHLDLPLLSAIPDLGKGGRRACLVCERLDGWVVERDGEEVQRGSGGMEGIEEIIGRSETRKDPNVRGRVWDAA